MCSIFVVEVAVGSRVRSTGETSSWRRVAEVVGVLAVVLGLLLPLAMVLLQRAYLGSS